MADLICDSGEIPEHVLAECGSEASGIIAVAFLEPEVNTDGSPEAMSTPEFWEALTGASPKQAHIIKNTRGEKPRSESVKGEGFGKHKEVVIGRNHTATFEFEGIKDNRDLVNRLNYRKDLKFVMVTNGGLLYHSDAPVAIDGDIDNGRDIDGIAFYGVDVTWTKNAIVQVYDAPEGIFD
jgi:hypothetical protein